ncbi:MAG: PAC2 family protein [Bifidobacteriaceae bacterium]|jgi:hypothetical protein|nr:PAC2 family protein [Bifidobacteriaceae bacterium]
MPSAHSPAKPRRFCIAAFAGWNDAGSAATDALERLVDTWDSRVIAALDYEDYYDLQVMRPRMKLNGTKRELIWPRTRILLATAPSGRQFLIIEGIEPSTRWEQFIADLMLVLGDFELDALITLGALLADVPHSREIPVTVSSDDPTLRTVYDLDRSQYTGPSGIVGVLDYVATERYGLPAMSLWAAVPHYVANPPSPKAELAILRKLEELVDEPIDVGDLEDEARAWTEGVDQLASEDEDIADYVHQLEEVKDTADSPEASGEALAREFERYLARHENDQGPSKPGRAPGPHRGDWPGAPGSSGPATSGGPAGPGGDAPRGPQPPA